MIHNVKLSPFIERKLSEVVKVQMVLLAYGAFSNAPSQEGCARYLHDQGFDSTDSTRSIKIVKWVWNSKERRDPLTGFASGPSDDKERFVERLRHETELLSASPPVGTISVIDIPDKPRGEQAKLWQEHAADFLQRFYDELSTTKIGLPTCLFSDPDAKNFRRQDFLSAFVAENKSLYVCAVCDESGSYTISNNKIHTDIEHYFPQSLYPHLACHPYNLIPICHLCNAAIHGAKDPLQPDKNDLRLQLQDIVLPYRNLSLGTATRLNVDLDSDSRTFTGLISVDQENAYETQIETLRKIYNIPERWNEQHDIDKVGETLFRRMRQFLRGSYELPIGNSFESVRPVLQYALYQLVYSLHTKGEEGYKDGDFGKDPFAFAMKWLMITILNEEQHSSSLAKEDGQMHKQSNANFPLFRELSQWLGQDMLDNDEYTSCTEELIRILNDETIVLNQNQATKRSI